MRRLIALTATAVVALALVPHGAAEAQDATAEDDLVVTITAPGDVTAEGTVQVTATIAESSVQDSIWKYSVALADAGGAQIATFCFKEYPQPDIDHPPVDNVSIAFSWNTGRVPAGGGDCEAGHGTVLPASGALSSNGKYTVVVTAETFGFPDPSFKDVDNPKSGVVTVSNVPATPTGVGLSYDKAAKTVKVSWRANPEPDITGYRVQECSVDKSSKPCSTWKTKADARGTSLDVKVEDPAIYRYRVAALRSGGAGEALVSTTASATGEPTEIEVVKDPDPQPEAPAESAEPQEPTTPATVTKTVVKPTRRVQRAAPEVVQQIVEGEPGFNSELPYEDGTNAAAGGLPVGDDGGGQEGVLIPVAGGLVFLMFAGQVWYLNRRAALEPIPLDNIWHRSP